MTKRFVDYRKDLVNLAPTTRDAVHSYLEYLEKEHPYQLPVIRIYHKDLNIPEFLRLYELLEKMVQNKELDTRTTPNMMWVEFFHPHQYKCLLKKQHAAEKDL